MNLISLGTRHSFADMLDACIQHGIRCIAPWQLHYQDIGARTATAEIHARGLRVSGLCRLAEFGSADTPARWQQALDTALRTLDEAAAMQALTLTYIGGSLPPGSKNLVDCRQRVIEGAHAIAPWCLERGIRLAIEPLHPMVLADRGCIGTLREALTLATALGDAAGLLVDTFNQWWDPALPQVLEEAHGKVVCYQVSDWLLDTRDLVFDRGLMGEGIIDFHHYRRLVEASGYDGFVEIELLSHRHDDLPPSTLVELLVERCIRHC